MRHKAWAWMIAAVLAMGTDGWSFADDADKTDPAPVLDREDIKDILDSVHEALQNARDVYSRRGEAVSLWVVPSSAITASTPEDMGPFFEPGNDKPYRHPQFYKVPSGVRGV